MMNSSEHVPEYIGMIRMLNPQQLAELLASIGGVASERDYGQDGNTLVGSAFMSAFVAYHESRNISIKIALDTEDSDTVYYRTGVGLCTGIRDDTERF